MHDVNLIQVFRFPFHDRLSSCWFSISVSIKWHVMRKWFILCLVIIHRFILLSILVVGDILCGVIFCLCLQLLVCLKLCRAMVGFD